MHPSPVLYDHARDEREAIAEAITAIADELAQGDEIIDIAGSLSADETATFEVALCRWYRGDRDALDVVRPIFAAHLQARATELYRKRDAQQRIEAAEAVDWSRAA